VIFTRLTRFSRFLSVVVLLNLFQHPLRLQ